MSTQAPTLTILETIAAPHADAGARFNPQTGDLMLSAVGGNPIRVPNAPAGLAMTHPAAGSTAAALNALYTRRNEVARINSDRRLSDVGRAERRVPAEVAATKTLLAAHADLAQFEHNVRTAEATLYAVPTLAETDAAGAALDAEMRTYLRGLSAQERIAALRSDPRMLAASMRNLRLSGVTSDHEIGRVTGEWRQACEARDPCLAERTVTLRDYTMWARKAITSAARAVAAEMESNPAEVVAALDVTDLGRFTQVFDLPPGARRLVAKRPDLDAENAARDAA